MPHLPHWNPIRLFALALAVLTSSCAPALAGQAIPVSGSLEARLVTALTARDLPTGDVRAVSLRDGTLTVDFAPEAASGLTEGALEAMSDAARAAFRDMDIEAFALTAGGRPLSDFLPPVPTVEPARTPRPRRTVSGSLAGKTIVLSPGHGWTYWGTSSAKATNPYWHLQRVYYYGIVEDFVNQEMIQYVYNLLANNGAEVYVTREMDKTYPDFTTAYNFAGVNRPAPDKPWWQMAALYYTYRKGAPSSVWDNGRTNDYDRDIAARPLYANWKGADIMVSLHNNGFDGTATGTETLYDSTNGQTDIDAVNQYGSKYLAQKLQSKIVGALRTNYYSAWYDRRAQGFDGSYGENRIATCPAALIETAFMDRPSPDNNALHDENFKMLVAKAIYEGICDYFHVTPTYNTSITAPQGQWMAQSWNRAAAFKLGSPLNAPVSSAGGWVYAGSENGVVWGISATPASGMTTALRWRFPTSTGLGAPVRARPTVYEDTVYAVATNGVLVALNRKTGYLIWQAAVPNAGSLTASPAATPDGYLVVGSDNGFLYTYRQDTGALANTSPVPFGAVRAQVAIPDSGHVWVTSEDGKVRCLAGDLKTILWETGTGAPVRSAPYVLTANNVVYFTNEASTVYALNASNGTSAAGWSASGARYGQPITTSPWADATSGIVAFGQLNHTISAAFLDAPLMPPTFPLAPAGVKEFTSDPVMLDGTIFIGGTDGRLYAVKGVEGSEPGASWRVFDSSREPLPGPFNAAPCLTGTGLTDMVAAGNANGYLYLLPLH